MVTLGSDFNLALQSGATERSVLRKAPGRGKGSAEKVKELFIPMVLNPGAGEGAMSGDVFACSAGLGG